jgi:hypothetical protein
MSTGIIEFRAKPLHAKGRPHQSHWKQENLAHEFQHSVNGDSDEAERKQEKPHERVED